MAAGLALLLLCSCQQAYFRTLNLGLSEDGATSVEFNATRALSLDVYRPRPATTGAPVVVFFYGGTWRDGSRSYYRFVGEALSRHGVLVVIPDYRKSPAHIFPTFMEDAAEAAAWARSHAAEFGGDPSRVHLMGHSAGAHMAALLATDARYLKHHGLEPRDFASVIGMSGPYDFLPSTEPLVKKAFGQPADWSLTQPLHFVDGDEPPFLLLHGGSDYRVKPVHSRRLAARLRAAGAPVTMRIIRNTGHVAVVNGFVSPRYSPVLRQTLDWIAAESSSPAAATTGGRR